MLSSTQLALADIYTGAFKVLVPAAASARWASWAERVGLQPIAVREQIGGAYVLELPAENGAGAEASPVPALPSNLLGMVSAEPADEGFWRDFVSSMQREGLDLPPGQVIRVDQESGSPDLAVALRERLAAALARNADLTSSLAILRREHQDTRRVLHRMQDALWAARSNPPEISAATAIARATLELAARDGGAQPNVTEQRLLSPALGLAGFDLHIAEGPASPALLIVRLVSADDGSVLGSWSADVSVTETGWLHFPLATVLTSDCPYVDIELELLPGGDGSLALSLAEERFLVSVDVRRDGVALPGKTLAMRIWTALPGTLNRNAPRHAASALQVGTLEYVVPAEALRSASPVGAYEASFEPLQYWEGAGLMVHPLQGREVGAILAQLLPAAARRVEAVVGIHAEAANDVEFAICARDPDDLRSIGEIETTEWAACSGWVLVRSRNRRERIALAVPERQGRKPLQLLLFTRVPNGRSVDFAQAIFFQIVVGFRSQRAGSDDDGTEVSASRHDQTRRASPLGSASDPHVRPASHRQHPEVAPLSGVGTVSRLVVLDGDVLKQARKLVRDAVPFDPVQVPGPDMIVVHPLSNRVFAVSLALPTSEGAQPYRIEQVEAVVGVGPDFAGTVEFRMALLADPADIALLEQSGSFSEWPGSSWFGVDHDERRQRFHWRPSEPLRAGHLCLMTKVPNGGSVDFSSAYFQAITLHVLA